MNNTNAPIYQGHRGCRGLMPENSIPAFEKALEYVNILEMDIVVSKDNKIIISHEAWMSSTIATKPDGSPVQKHEAKKIKLYQLTYEEIKSYDVGLRPHPKFPDQIKLACYKPSLIDMVRHIDLYCKTKSIPLPSFDIEIKSEKDHYGIFIPEPKEYVRILLAEINELQIKSRINLQSFDINILEEIKIQDPEIVIAYLIDNIKDLKSNLKKLSFKPDIYSPNFRLVSKKLVKKCHEQNIKVIPWTVNKKKHFRKLTKMGVDGIITDYPDRV